MVLVIDQKQSSRFCDVLTRVYTLSYTCYGFYLRCGLLHFKTSPHTTSCYFICASSVADLVQFSSSDTKYDR